MTRVLQPASLRRRRIRQLGETLFRCESCGTTWSPNVQPGGGFRRLWWVCPERRCNEEAGR